MIKLKFISVLQTFTNDEFKSFGKFLNSPYFNSNKKIVILYDMLKQYYPSFSSKKLTKENLYAKLCPGKKYLNKQMEKISSEMLHQAEEYLRIVGIKKAGFINDHYLLHELNERKLFNLFNRRLMAAEKKLDKENVHNSRYFLNKYWLEDEKIYFLNNRKSAPFYLNDNAQKIADNLTDFFLISILRIYSYMINQSKNAYDYNFRFDFLKQVKSYIEANSFKNIYIEMFYNSMMLLLYGKDENFENLRKIVSDNFDKIERVDRMNMYVVLTNYCFRQYNLGRDEYLRKDFEIYNDILQRGAYYTNYYLHHLHYKNIVSCSIGLKEFEWTKNFIEKYKKDLLSEHQSSSYHLCYALLDFAGGNYEKSLEAITKVNMEDITYKFDTKCLMTQIYYQMNEQESFYSLVDTYKHMLTKNKLVPAKNKEQHFQFIRFIHQINKLREKNDGMKLDRLKLDGLKLHETKKELLSTEAVKNKRWLLEKIDELYK